MKVADNLRCSSTTISNRLKEFNIPIRPTREYLLGNKNCGVGENNSNWKPEKHKSYYCKELGCKNLISYKTFKKGTKKCGSCNSKGNKNMLGKTHSKAAKHKMKNAPVYHHVYLKENSEESIVMDRAKHSLLHQKVYEYIFEQYGKKGVDRYLKWFAKKYGLVREKQ